MLQISQEAIDKYSKYLGPDGKFIIDESVPEELRETLKFFNESNIDIHNLSIEELDKKLADYNDGFDEEPDVETDDDDTDSFEDEDDSDNQNNSVNIEEKSDVDFDIF
jgi:hypothetical protein